MTVYCANCDAEAVCRVQHADIDQSCHDPHGTPLCFTCRTAYEWGQASPTAGFEDIDQSDDGHELDEDGDQIHQFGPFVQARFTGNPVRHCQVPGCKEMTMDGDEDDEPDGDDLCDTCMRSGVEVHRTDEHGNTVCVECDRKQVADNAPLYVDADGNPKYA